MAESTLLPSLTTMQMARVIASGLPCWKMLRPTEQPTAPARMASSSLVSRSRSDSFDPPATTTGTGLRATSSAKVSASPVQFVLITSAPSSAHRRTLLRRYSRPYFSMPDSTVLLA